MQAESLAAVPVVKVAHLSKLYGSGAARVNALIEINLQIERGEFLALNGPSGSGKTTLLNLIGALDVASSGTVDIEGQRLSSLSRRALALLRRDRIGFVFQSHNLIPIMSAFENAEFTLVLQRRPRQERRQLAMEALAQVGLKGLEKRLPSELSGGQQQRVAVARAIAPRPSLILADEPTASLDSASAISLLDLMQDLNKTLGISFVFSTHDPRVLTRARRIVPMRDGQILSDADAGGGLPKVAV